MQTRHFLRIIAGTVAGLSFPACSEKPKGSITFPDFDNLNPEQEKKVKNILVLLDNLFKEVDDPRR